MRPSPANLLPTDPTAPAHAQRLIDIGLDAGFPGLPINDENQAIALKTPGSGSMSAIIISTTI
jgi:hypothetical protein